MTDVQVLREAVTQAASAQSHRRLVQAARALFDADSGAGTVRFLARVAQGTSEEGGGLRPLRVALLSSFSIEFARDALVACALANGMRLTLYQAPFGSFRQEILDPASGLYAFKPQAVILAVEPNAWIAADSNASSSAQLVSEVEALARAFRERSGAALLCHNFPLPRWPAAPVADEHLRAADSAAFTAACNHGLRGLSRSVADFHVVDYASLVNRAGYDRWFDDRMRLYAKAPIAQAMYPVLAREYLRHLRGLVGLTRKCLVVDLDNTLWGGILGEDGVDGVKLGPDYPGSAFVEFQQFILQLRSRGTILAIASKNNPPDVEQMFHGHKFMALKWEHFSSRQIGWMPKAESLVAIARELNIGLEHMVFVDDSPFEVEHIREALPEVTVIQLPGEPSQYVQALAQDGWFDAASVSDEDRRRGELYQQREQAESLRVAAGGNLEDFYRDLDMELTIAPVNAASLKRAAQLTQKTNQFNVTTRRYTEGDVAKLMADPSWVACTVSVRDKFGDNGIVGIMFAGEQAGELRIDTLLMSCRVIGRTVETAMLAFLCDHAHAKGIARVRGTIIPTEKNVPVRDLFSRHGFSGADAGSEGASEWLLDTATAPVAYPTWFRLSIDEAFNHETGERARRVQR
jgi:FkbH-like protein